MDDVLLVSIGQRARYVDADADSFLCGEPLILEQSMVQSLAVDERHDIEQQISRFARVIDGHDVWVREARRHLDLSEKTLCCHRPAELRQENLDRNLAVVLEVESQVHRGHAATADLLIDRIAIGESGSYSVDGIGH